MFFKQTRNFQEGLSNRHVFFQESFICSSNRPYYQILIFPETLIYTSNTYEFSRSLYILIEQLFIFQEALSDTLYSRRPLCLEQIGIFQEGTTRRTDILIIGLGGCFRLIEGYGFVCKDLYRTL